ncbi:MAG: sugar phosphate isomerase/epimerase [Clostridia bacterium]|nr:sugar phosphate isomerase/epimerase [Clostridia bacterium]
MRKLGISTVGGHPENPDIFTQLHTFAEVGFDCFFTGTGVNTPIADVVSWAEEAARCGLLFETIHAPFGSVNALWKDELSGDECLENMKTIVRQCHAAGVDKMIMHVTIGNTAPEVSEVGLARFKRLEEFAEGNGVHLCYENLEPLPHLHAVMKQADAYHGFCLDIGHNCCYTPHIPMMALYGDRILCTHIHDNRGVTRPGDIHYRDDNHLLPFDGVLDWEWFAKNLCATGYAGPLTFELSCSPREEYRSGTFRDFAAEAFSRAKRIRGMMEE